MDAQTLFGKYIEIKKENEEAKLPIEANYAYLSGWLDCANFILKELENDKTRNNR